LSSAAITSLTVIRRSGDAARYMLAIRLSTPGPRAFRISVKRGSGNPGGESKPR
jgi:hypothetical protein